MADVCAAVASISRLLLAGLTLTWGPSDRTIHNLAEAAMIGQRFLQTLIVVQLAVVLLAAPAATAGAVCVDKSRGTLLHAFVTDLTDREIVLGKLGARLAPVLSLLAFGLPVLALGSFLGGIDLEAALGAELVTAGTAILCCTPGISGLGLGPQAAPGPAPVLHACRPLGRILPGPQCLCSAEAPRRRFRNWFCTCPTRFAPRLRTDILPVGSGACASRPRSSSSRS